MHSKSQYQMEVSGDLDVLLLRKNHLYLFSKRLDRSQYQYAEERISSPSLELNHRVLSCSGLW
jgi:hypothetical protein